MSQKISDKSSVVRCDLGSYSPKQTLLNIAANKGLTLTSLVRSTLFKMIEETPDHLKRRRRYNDEDVD